MKTGVEPCRYSCEFVSISGFQLRCSAATALKSQYFHRTFRHGIHKVFAIVLGEDPVVEDGDDTGVGFGANKPAHALTELQNGFRQGNLAESVTAARLDGLDASFDQWMVRNGKRQAGDDY